MLNPHSITRLFVLFTVPALYLANGVIAEPPAGNDLLVKISETQREIAAIGDYLSALKHEASKISEDAREYKKLYDETGKREYLAAYTSTMERYESVITEYESASQKHKEATELLEFQVQKLRGEIDETEGVIEQLELTMNDLMDKANSYIGQAEAYKELYERTHQPQYLAAYQAAYEDYEKTLGDFDVVATKVKKLSNYVDEMVEGLARLGL